MIKRILYIIVLIVLSFGLYSQEADSYRLSMRKATNNGNYNLALKIYNDALEDDYYDMESLERIQVEIYYRVEEYDKALSVCKKLYNEGEGSTLVNLIYMCLLSRQSGNNDSVIYQIGEQTIEDSFDKNILYSMQMLSKQDVNKVINSLTNHKKELALRKEDPEKSINSLLTLLYYYNNRYMDAYTSSMEILSEANDPVIYYILGYLKQRQQEYSSAISFYTSAIRGGYNHYDAYLNRAICKGWEKEYLASNQDLDTCLAIDSNYYIFYLKGVNYSHLYQYQDAVLQFDYALTLNDTFTLAYNYRGVVSTNLQQYEFAVLDFKHAIDLDYKTPFAHNNLGMAYEQLGRIEEAIKEFEISTKIEKDFEGGWYNLGRMCTQLGQTYKAIKCLKRCVVLAPEIPDVYYLLGVNYERKENKKKACEYYNIALSLNHTKAQDKIDNYCNKEEEKEKEKKKKDSLEDEEIEQDEEIETEGEE